MTRPVTLRAAAAALLTTALLLASCTKPPAVELRSQLRTLIGADTAPVTMLNITDGLEARTFVDGTERIISTKSHSANQLRRVEPGRSWGFARPLADWDLDGLVASLPAECVLRRSDTRVHALALAGSAAYVEAHCGDTTSARIGDHDVAPLREWWSRESLATLFDEVRLISGSSEVTGLSVEGAPGRQWLAFTVRHSGEQAETHVRRALGDLESYSPRIIGVGAYWKSPKGRTRWTSAKSVQLSWRQCSEGSSLLRVATYSAHLTRCRCVWWFSGVLPKILLRGWRVVLRHFYQNA